MTPSVSVIIAVYNTVRYLPETLASLERQTIGFDQVQVLLVDDGSTDGSERIIDEFAARHPQNVVAVHQPNSGGPASPFNRGLERATGRWVFFLGSDDYLDDDALQVLVEHGDRWESDVIFGRMEPVGERKVPIEIFKLGRVADMDLYSSRLPYVLANSKMFRRSLVEDLGLRYREDMRQRCDQPFTVTAMIHARRISMIGDGAVYFAREREDRSNVTYTADAAEMYASTAIIMDTIAEALPPGPQRDHVMKRQFDNTIRGDLRDSLSLREPDEREFVYDRIAELSQRYLTPELLRSMKVLDRAVLRAALDRDTERALALLALSAGGEHSVGLHLEGDRAFFTYPGFDPAGEHREVYEITAERPLKRIAGLFSPATAAVEDDLVVLRGTVGIHGAIEHQGRFVRAPAGPSRAVRSSEPPQRGRRVDARVENGTYRVSIDVRGLSSRVFLPSIAVVVNDEWYDVPLRFEGGSRPLRPGLFRRRLGVARADEAGHLVLDLS
ncbi:glycosyltransferase family A protein [Aeromicrobium sp.]|uniref:glycosyltransferase family 2 protein n=1 Tax=Aeromicrobium sp. TaxID=1871063 RepID=UPI0028AD4DA1|nr:glycosyltransferase family A protein [Aeromicrobium sp.]